MGYLANSIPIMFIVSLKNLSGRILEFRITMVEFGHIEKYICNSLWFCSTFKMIEILNNNEFKYRY